MLELAVGQPDLLILLVGVLTGLATFAGGSLALRFGSSIALLAGLSGGAVVGVALCDLLPEALELSRGSHTFLDVTIAVAGGFATYFTLERTCDALKESGRGYRRHLAPASLTLHSLMDGLGIGLAFQVSSA